MGNPDGDKVGNDVGKLVGDVLGLELGKLEGIEVGLEVGEEVGAALGDALGILLGEALGVELGNTLGNSLGEGLGNAVPILISNNIDAVSGHSTALPLTPLQLLVALYFPVSHSKISTSCENELESCGRKASASGRETRVSPFTMKSHSVDVAAPRPSLFTVTVYVTSV